LSVEINDRPATRRTRTRETSRRDTISSTSSEKHTSYTQSQSDALAHTPSSTGTAHPPSGFGINVLVGHRRQRFKSRAGIPSTPQSADPSVMGAPGRKPPHLRKLKTTTNWRVTPAARSRSQGAQPHAQAVAPHGHRSHADWVPLAGAPCGVADACTARQRRAV